MEEPHHLDKFESLGHSDRVGFRHPQNPVVVLSLHSHCLNLPTVRERRRETITFIGESPGIAGISTF